MLVGEQKKPIVLGGQEAVFHVGYTEDLWRGFQQHSVYWCAKKEKKRKEKKKMASSKFHGKHALGPPIPVLGSVA